MDSTNSLNSSRPRVFLDVAIGNRPPARMIFMLYSDKVPKTVENFRHLCRGDTFSLTNSQLRLTLKLSQFHRIIPGFMAQGGDFTRGDGYGGESIYGRTFPDENFHYKHSEPGLLSMANSGPNTNGSQFFITFRTTPHLDGKHMVFGKLIDGMAVLRSMEQVVTGPNDRPRQPVTIIDCGELDSNNNNISSSSSSTAEKTAVSNHHQETNEESYKIIETAKELLAGEDRRRLLKGMNEQGLPLSFHHPNNNGGTTTITNSTLSTIQDKQDTVSTSHSDTQSLESELTKVLQQNILKKKQEKEEKTGPYKSSIFGNLAVPSSLSSSTSSHIVPKKTTNHRGLVTEYDNSSDSESNDIVTASLSSSSNKPLAEAHIDTPTDQKDNTTTTYDEEENEKVFPPTEKEEAEEESTNNEPRDPTKEKLFQLRLRMAAGRKDNHNQVVSEHKRTVDPQAAKRERWAAETAAREAEIHRTKGRLLSSTTEQEESTGENGNNNDPNPSNDAKRLRVDNEVLASVQSLLTEPAAVAEHKAAQLTEKERNQLRHYGSRGTSGEALYYLHDKRVNRSLGGSKYSSSSTTVTNTTVVDDNDIVGHLLPGQALLTTAVNDNGTVGSAINAAAFDYGKNDFVDNSAVDRLAQELQETDNRRKKYHRHRKTVDEAGNVHISESNRRFTEQISKAYDKYTIEIKQNIERGTAL